MTPYERYKLVLDGIRDVAVIASVIALVVVVSQQ